MINIVEKYITIGGEAPLLGIPIYIIRLTGCNLNCIYCDTYYKDEINFSFTHEKMINDILKTTKKYNNIKILFTGGEPLLNNRQNEILMIIKKLKHLEFFIETNGSIQIQNFKFKNCHYIVDWKTPSSKSDKSFYIKNINYLRPGFDCIKIVISKDDLKWLKKSIKIIQNINYNLPVYISPQWNNIQLKEIADFILKNKLQTIMSIQLHKYIWKDKKRGI